MPSMMDFDTDVASNPADPTASHSPEVAALRYAREQHALRMAQQQQQMESAKLAAEHERKVQEQMDIERSGRTMANDAAQWALTPEYKGKSFASAPQEAQQHFINAYGNNAAQAPAAWNEAQRAMTGDPTVGLEQIPMGSQASSDVAGSKVQVGNIKARTGIENRARALGIDPTGVEDAVLNAQIAERAGESTVPAEIRTELIRNGLWNDKMTPAQATEAFKTMQNGQGIPPHLVNTARELSRANQANPTLREYGKIKDAFDSLEQGFKSPASGGFSDMAMIEGFQRLVNPGAAVRTQTMTNMLHAAGITQYANWDFLVNKLQQGDKLSPDARQRLFNLAQGIFQQKTSQAGKALAGARNAARRYGIPDPEGFVNDSLSEFVPDETAPAQPANVNPYQAAIEWLQDHPKDPFSAAVKAHLQKLGALK